MLAWLYLLIFVLQSASAALAPPPSRRQSPMCFTDEEDYTKALSLSRLAYDLESVASPMLGEGRILFAVIPSRPVCSNFGWLSPVSCTRGLRHPAEAESR